MKNSAYNFARWVTLRIECETAADIKTSRLLMIMRCGELGVLNEVQEKLLWINYNRRGWRTEEPLDDVSSVEQPRMLRRSIEMLIIEGIKSKQSIFDDRNLHRTDIEELCGLLTGFLSDKYEAVMTMAAPKFRDDIRSNTNAGVGGIIPFSKKQ
jgi:hypothetical protein